MTEYAAARSFSPTRSPLLPVVLGVIAFLLVIGPDVLRPSNLGWLGSGDPLTHFLGWQFFRDSAWTLPLGLNPRYGLDLGNSIVFSDSLPLLAIPLKLVSPLLPASFQYFGVWLLGCFVLQAWFSWKLLGLYIADGPTRLLGCIFFVLAPPMLWRMFGHLSLSAHFLVVAALYLCLRPGQSRRTSAWAALLVAASATHGYLLMMVLPLWAASLTAAFRVARRAEGSSARCFVEALGIPGLVLFSCWQLGYFTVGRSATNSDGYGFFRMNMLGLVNPLGWSRMLDNRPHGAGDYEGFSYLGAGVLALVVCAVPILVRQRRTIAPTLRRRWPLVTALACLTAFAITHRIGVDGRDFLLRIPPWFERMANTFRASGRVIWPVYYFVLLVVLAAAARGLSVRTARLVFAIAIAMQVADTSKGWQALKPHYEAASSPRLIESPLTDPFWAEAATRYGEVRLVTPSATHPHWAIFADYAATHRLGTNAIYLARVDGAKLVRSIESASRAIQTGDYAADALYVLDDEQVMPALMHLKGRADLVSKIDGFNVIAPGWNACTTCRRIASTLSLAPLVAALRPVSIGDHIDFAQAGNAGRFLLGGFWTPEEPGTWSKGRQASLMFTISGPRPTRLVVEAAAFVLPVHPEQRIEVRIDGGPVIPVTLTESKGNRFELAVPARAATAGSAANVLSIEVTSLDSVRPVDIGMNADTRALSFGINSVDFR